MNKFEKEFDKNFNNLDILQQKAVMSKAKISLIYGEGGVGKTVVGNVRCDLARARGEKFVVIAPTAAAAKNYEDGKTMHSFLGMREVSSLADEEIMFLPRDKDIIEIDVVLIDECSMVGEKLFNIFLKKVKFKQLIIMGDRFQLPPIKDKAVDYESLVDEKFELIKNYRQNDPGISAVTKALREAIDTSKTIDIGGFLCDTVKVVSKADAIHDWHINGTTERNKVFLTSVNTVAEGNLLNLKTRENKYMTLSKFEALIKDTNKGNMVIPELFSNGEIISIKEIGFIEADERRKTFSKHGYVYMFAGLKNPVVKEMIQKFGFKCYIPLDSDEDEILFNGVGIPFFYGTDNKGIKTRLISYARSKIVDFNNKLEKSFPGFENELKEATRRDYAAEVACDKHWVTDLYNRVCVGDLKKELGALHTMRSIANKVVHLRHVSSMTVHKSQGASIGSVYIDSLENNQKLWYVALSRARNKIIIVNNSNLVLTPKG